ncbi:MAG TPA: HlyD family secretion protein [Gemmataceae bacterium]|jgi:multidrug resistance efflux pump|nr:HlyD family secretion protein [Gemmataceae bacterium]
MVELIVGTYGVLCWLLFKKFKLIPITTYSIVTAFLGGGVILLLLYIFLSVFHPVSHDGRIYAPVVQIVPNVRGLVIEVPIEANKPIKKGEVLFRIDPKPFQIEVDRLRASLAVKNVNLAQLSEKLAEAEAATKQAVAQQYVSESQFERQARENYEKENARVAQVNKQLDLAKQNLARIEPLAAKLVATQQDLDVARTRVASLEEENNQAVAAANVAKEQMKTGNKSLEAVRQDIVRLEAIERGIRLQVKAELDGVNPEVREVEAELENARWRLEQTEVRAPSDGYVPQLTLRPGQLVLPVPLTPVMVFVPTDEKVLIATFAQKAISDIKPGMNAEVTFEAFPGKSFKVKVKRVFTIVPEGEVLASGKLLEAADKHDEGRIPVSFEYGEDIAALNLPAGTQASVAVYTDRVHALSIVRKIILRMKSWEHFVI